MNAAPSRLKQARTAARQGEGSPVSLDRFSTELLRWSLVWVWLTSAVVSIWERDGQSTALLHSAGLRDPLTIAALVWVGAGLDAVLGLAMCFKPARVTYLAALAATLLMTLVATALLPELWLHPLGPLTKNLPLVVMLVLLARQTP